MKTLVSLTTLCLLVTACSNAEIGNIKDVNPATVYTKYYVHYIEGEDSMVTFKAKFSFAGPNGTTLVLNAPAKVELDGEGITLDTTTSEGAVYEIKKLPGAFAGSHTVTFTNYDGHSYTNRFTFTPFTFNTPLPESITIDSFTLSFNGLAAADSINLRIEDTAAQAFDIVLAANNKVRLGREVFNNMHPGPLAVAAGRLYETPLEKVTPEGGSIFFMYALAVRKTALKK